ncbi:MAG: hypothetical protein JST58_06415 [Bacteroidetes bacterium]|nr:hypothetical protein [Bacteroidota bacterium]
MKFNLFFIALLSLLFIFSCSKEKSYSASNSTTKLKMYIEDARNSSLNSIDTQYLAYDANNRITAMTSTQGKEVYTYTSNNQFTLDLYLGTTLSIHELFFINSNSLVDSTRQDDQVGDTSTEGYLYNGKQLSRKTMYNYTAANGSQIYTQEDYTYDSNGNLVKDIESDGSGNISMTTTYTYNNYSFVNLLSPVFLPIQSKNLPATMTQKDGSGGLIGSIGYSYVFDSSNRLIKETDLANNGETVVKTYLYF